MSNRNQATGSDPDPLVGFLFSLELDGMKVGYFSECSGIQVEYEVLEHPEGGQNDFVHKLRGRKKYPNLVLKRGITSNVALQKWIFETKEWDQRGQVTVTMFSHDYQPVRKWAFANAFPVKWQGPSMKGGVNDLATETVEIAHRGLVPTVF